MSRLSRRLASLMAVVTLLASPTVVAACLSACVPGAASHQAMSDQPAPAVVAAEVPCAGHPAAGDTPQPVPAIGVAGASCCLDASTAPAAAADAVTRVEARTDVLMTSHPGLVLPVPPAVRLAAWGQRPTRPAPRSVGHLVLRV